MQAIINHGNFQSLMRFKELVVLECRMSAVKSLSERKVYFYGDLAVFTFSMRIPSIL